VKVASNPFNGGSENGQAQNPTITESKDTREAVKENHNREGLERLSGARCESKKEGTGAAPW